MSENEGQPNEPTLDPEAAQHVVQQALEFWINPEIAARREAGTLADDFALRSAQVIFDVDAEAPEVRLNEEVKAVALITAARGIKKGQDVTEDDIAAWNDIGLTHQDPNAGHLTIVQTSAGWMLAFDFRRNAGRIAEHLAAAEEFLESARHAAESGHDRVFIDNLLSAVELMAKSHLIAAPDEGVLRSRRHGVTQARFNESGKMGNVDPRYPRLLNRLWELRRPARYLSKDFNLATSERDSMLEVGAAMLEKIRASSPKRYGPQNDERSAD